MHRSELEPLPLARWLSEMSALSDCCAVGKPGHEDRAVRRAYHLFKLSVPSIRSLADADLEESAVELMLDNEGPEAATKLIAGERASFAIAETDADDPRIAAEISFDRGPPIRGEGNSVAYAMIGAWANFFTTVH